MMKIVNCSGGKDSTAMLIMMLEQGIPIDRVLYADVGPMAEFESQYEYIKKVSAYAGIQIETVRSERWTAKTMFYGYPSRGKHMDEIRGFPKTVGSACRYRSWLKVDPLEQAAGQVQKGDIITITCHRPYAGAPPDACEGLSAEVREVYPNGSAYVRLLYHNALFGIEEFANLAPNTFAKAAPRPYGVTVCRTGFVPGVMAVDEAQAMRVVNTFIVDADVSWSEDWPASDAEIEEA
jgi:hypothetical protein